jgi:phosphatidylglycerophosphate synthase
MTIQNETIGQIRERLRSAQKPAAAGSPPYSIYVNRKVGRYFAAVAFRLGLTPNGVTAISAAFTYAGILLLAIAPPVIPTGIGVWLLLAIGYALDSADGQVARLRGGGSVAGEWLDHVVDSGKIVSLHLAVLISAARFDHLPTPWLLLVPIGFTIVSVVQFFALILNDLLKTIHGLRTGVPAAKSTTERTVTRTLLLIPTDYGALCTSFILLGFTPVFAIVYGILFLCNAGFLTLALRKWFGDMARLQGSR